MGIEGPKDEQARQQFCVPGTEGLSPGQLKTPTWQPKSSMSSEVKTGQRDQDDAEVAKWTKRLTTIFQEGGAPTWKQAQTAQDPLAAMAGVVGKARASTMRTRIRRWEAFARWLAWTRGRTWPQDVADLLDYVQEQRVIPCAPTFPESFGAAVNWVEARGGIEPGPCLGGPPSFAPTLESSRRSWRA